jgi:anti-sigma regulatory factor (Ser/Thr protein kinase)
MTAPQQDGGTSQAVTAGLGPALEPVTVLLPPRHHEHRLADRWPLRSYREFGAMPSAVPCARAHTRQVVREWGSEPAELADSAELIVSELVTNAVIASRAMPEVPPVRLWLTSDRVRMLILVGDQSPQPLLRIAPRADPEEGRGLLLVEVISDRWGWHPAGAPGLVKIVWAELVGPDPELREHRRNPVVRPGVQGP